MKLYRIYRMAIDNAEPLFGCYATERGLERMAATIQNQGRSQASGHESQKIVKELAAGRTVADPNFPKITWVAKCLGNQFSYCKSWLFPSKDQVAKLMEGRSL